MATPLEELAKEYALNEYEYCISWTPKDVLDETAEDLLEIISKMGDE